MPKRLLLASGLLEIAIDARDDYEARCDVISIVRAVLPIFLEDHEDYHGRTGAGFQYCQYKKYHYEILILSL